MARTDHTTDPQPSDRDGASPLGTRELDDSATAHDRAERQRQRDARRQAGGPEPPATDQRAPVVETRGARIARKAHRGRLHLYSLIAVLVLVYVVALAASNTAHVKVNWVFGSSSVALVWLVLFAAILGWALGVLITALFRWRTRAPRAS